MGYIEVTFLSLNTHAGNGGIEKFNRSLMAALALQEKVYNLALHDRAKPNANNNHRGYSGNILRFAWAFFFRCFRTKHIIIGHLNLAPIAWLGSFLFPRKKQFLVVHGLELWMPLNFFKKQLLKRAHQCITVSAFSAQRLQALGVAADRIQILHNTLGVDDYQVSVPSERIDQWKRKNASLQNAFILLTTARMKASEAYKGYDRVIQALPQLAREIPNIHYVLVGKYDDEEKSRLDALIQQYQLQNRVTFTGFVSDEELHIWMQEAHVFAMPSTMEGFGIVYIEAMASGTPVLAGNKDGSVDALAGGKLGTLVDPESIPEITKALMHIHQNYDSVLKGEALRQAAIEHFGFARFKNRVHEIFS